MVDAHTNVSMNNDKMTTTTTMMASNANMQREKRPPNEPSSSRSSSYHDHEEKLAVVGSSSHRRNEHEASSSNDNIVNTTDMMYELLTNPSIQAAASRSRQSSFPTCASSSLITASSSSATLSSVVTSSSTTDAAHNEHNERLGHDTKMMQLPSSPRRVRNTVRVRLHQFCKINCIPLRRYYTEKIKPFRTVTVAQVLCATYILVLTFSHPPVGITDPTSGNIIDPNSVENTKNGVIYLNGVYRPVVALGHWQKVFLAISRISAFSMYPMLVILFVTKMKALQSFFSKTPLSMYLGILNQAHDYHAHAGAYIALDVWVHTLFHLLRWLAQGNIHLLWTSAAGISGLITVVATPLITFPMMYFKDSLRYEIRKG